MADRSYCEQRRADRSPNRRLRRRGWPGNDWLSRSHCLRTTLRILFLADNFPPEVNAPASRTFEHCREWVKAGHAVTVITCAPNFPQGRIHAGYRNRLYRREMIDGIAVVRVWSYITANAGFFKRVLDYLSFALTSFIAGLFERCDVIIATSPQFFTSWAGWALAKLKRRPWLFEVRDLWPASIAAVGAMGNPRVLGWLERIELALYRAADRVVVVTDAFRDDLVARGIAGDKIAVVTNGVDLDHFQPLARDTAIAARYGCEDKLIVAYIGTQGAAHGLSFIIDCAASVFDGRIHFLFVGAGADREAVIERARNLALTNVSFVEPVPKQEVARYIAAAHIMLVPLRKAAVFRTVIPSKIFEAAAMERPILLGVDGEARGIVERFGAGLAFEPENRADFLAALERMTQDPEAYRAMQAGCRELAKAYDRRRLAQAMLDELELVVLARDGRCVDRPQPPAPPSP